MAFFYTSVQSSRPTSVEKTRKILQFIFKRFYFLKTKSFFNRSWAVSSVTGTNVFDSRTVASNQLLEKLNYKFYCNGYTIVRFRNSSDMITFSKKLSLQDLAEAYNASGLECAQQPKTANTIAHHGVMVACMLSTQNPVIVS